MSNASKNYVIVFFSFPLLLFPNSASSFFLCSICTCPLALTSYVTVAQQCGGTVYVMSCTPKNLAKFGRIWANDEWPALKNNYLYAAHLDPPSGHD